MSICPMYGGVRKNCLSASVHSFGPWRFFIVGFVFSVVCSISCSVICLTCLVDAFFYIYTVLFWPHSVFLFVDTFPIDTESVGFLFLFTFFIDFIFSVCCQPCTELHRFLPFGSGRNKIYRLKSHRFCSFLLEINANRHKHGFKRPV